MTATAAPRWREQMDATFGLSLPAPPIGARGLVRHRTLGHIDAFRVAGTPQLLRRTPNAIRAAESAPLKVCAVRAGEVVLRRDDLPDLRLGPGDIALYDTGRPYELRLMNRWNCTVMTIAHDDLALPSRTLCHALEHQLPGQGPGAVLTQLLESAVDDAFARSDTAILLGHATVDLLAGLAYELDAPTAPDHALRIAVLGYIREHLGDPDLGVTSIARAHHISSRTLHRLFSEEEWTVSETIRNLRLDAVRADLVNPNLAGRSIMAIAATRGFYDQSHLTRAFRTRFGTTPAAARREV